MSKNRQQKKLKTIFVPAAIAVITIAAYWGVWNNGFVDFDDNEYITTNQQVQAGLTGNGIRWAFTTEHASNWHPLTWLSHMMDCEFFGLNAGGHHIVSLVIHIVNSLLVFWAIKLMTGAYWRSAFVAVLFAIHPLHVESVGWAAERKDVLSTFFWMLTMMAYALYVKADSGRKWYICSLFAFALGLLAKPMLVSLPFVLLLLDYWPLERVGLRQSGESFRKLIVEKIPFFILACISCVVTMYAQRAGGAVKGLYMLSLKFRIGNAIVSYTRYIGKMFFPKDLVVFYPHPGDGLSFSKVVMAAVLLVCISIFVFARAKKMRWLLVGWFWFVGTLIPVIGLVQVGAQAMADRYTYIPLIGLFVIVAWSVTELLGSWKYKQVFLSISACVVIIILSVLTFKQVRYWENDLTLFGRVAIVDEDNYTGNFNLARAFSKAGRPEKAIEHYRNAVRIEPDSPEAKHNLAIELFKKGKIDESIKYYRMALKLDSSEAKMHYNLGLVLEMKGNFSEAQKYYLEAIKLNKDYSMAYYHLANTLNKLGKTQEAIKAYQQVLRIEPQNTTAKRELEAILKR